MTVSQRTIAELVTSDIAQTGANGPDEFDYVDISSVDNRTKRIEAPKRLAASDAPSRARQLLRVNDVLVSMTRPNLNAVALVPPSLDGAIGSTGFHVLRAEQNTEPAWLFYAVQSPQFVHAMSELVQGALYPAVRPKDIRSFALLVPSRAVQQEIVAYLDEQLSRLDASVAALRRVQANLKRYRASVLKSACEGRLVPTEAELVGQQVGAGNVLLPKLPSTWTWINLGDLIQEGPQNGLYVPKADYGSGIPIVRISDYQNGWSRPFGELQRVNISEELARNYRLVDHDILVNRVNSLTHLGKTLLVRGQAEMPVFESNMMRMRLTPAVLPEYAEFYLQSTEGRARLIKGAKWAVNQASINQRDVRACPFPLPPLAEQHRIVAEADRRLSLIRVAEAQVDANLARAQRLRQSILQAAFDTPA